MNRTSHTVFIGLGSNMGNRLQQLRRATRSLIDTHPTLRIPILTSPRLSSIYETNPIGVIDQPQFLNAVITGKTTLSPEELLFALKSIEQDLGRIPREPNSPREIDLDILLMDNVVCGGDPRIPHSRLVDRAFALAPLCELAPDRVHPCGKRIDELLANVDQSGIVKTHHVWFLDRDDDTSTLIPVRDFAFYERAPFEEPKRIVLNALKDVGMFRESFDRGYCTAFEHESHVHEKSPMNLLGDELRLKMSAILDLPQNVLSSALRWKNETGYTPPGIEGVRGHPSDFMRHFWDVRPGDGKKIDENMNALQQIGDKLTKDISRVSHNVFRTLDRLFSQHIADGAQGGSHLFRVSHYLNQTSSPLEVLFPSHVDFGLLTAYIGGASAGLQMKLNGVWHDVYNPPGSVIFAAGTTLQMFIPEIRAVRHRVVGSSVGRISAVLFTELRPDVLLPNGKTNGEHLAAQVYSIRKTKEGLT